MDYNNFFLEKALENRDYLLSHEVLSNYQDKISIIMKGSTARRCADIISDTDIVIFTDAITYNQIVEDYHRLGMSPNDNGIFLGMPYGHYNLDKYSTIEKYITEKNIPQIWEYSTIDILHDPKNTFKDLTFNIASDLFKNEADTIALIQRYYLDMRLKADWMQQPLKRSDYFAAFLHYASFIRLVSQICYLIDKKPYPHDKWIGYYLSTTSLGSKIKETMEDYICKASANRNIEPMKTLPEYFQYSEGINIIESVKTEIRNKYSDFPWLEQWTYWV